MSDWSIFLLFIVVLFMSPNHYVVKEPVGDVVRERVVYLPTISWILCMVVVTLAGLMSNHGPPW